jgi:poly(3-hydroxybutyrate) depolymerase
MANFNQGLFQNPLNPLANTYMGKSIVAACDFFESTTRRYGKPSFGLDATEIGGTQVPVIEEVVWSDTFCDLLYFNRDVEVLKTAKARARKKSDPKVLLIAPLSGHYATLLRGTVEAMLPEHEVYITDWADARTVPMSEGSFDLNSSIDYLIEMLRHLGPNTHVMAVCQPGPAALCATAVMAKAGDPNAPASLTIMGSPIDTRKSPTVPTELAEERPIEWFKNNVVMSVPWPHLGFMRSVYPGFIQLSSFLAMNQSSHMDAHREMFFHLVEGDGDSADKHREFYDEYLSVMDLTAEFYLQTVEEIFQKHSIAKGTFEHHGESVDPSLITKTALLTIEGANDDISGVGQTQAAHDLCSNIPAAMKQDYVQADVGHYGVFNGSKWREEIQPKVRDFIRSHNGG